MTPSRLLSPAILLALLLLAACAPAPTDAPTDALASAPAAAPPTSAPAQASPSPTAVPPTTEPATPTEAPPALTEASPTPVPPTSEPATPTQAPPTPEATPTPKKYLDSVQLTVNVETANLRKGPGTEYGIVTSFDKGQEFRAGGRYTNEKGEVWIKIGDGLWIFANLTSGDYSDLKTATTIPAPVEIANAGAEIEALSLMEEAVSTFKIGDILHVVHKSMTELTWEEGSRFDEILINPDYQPVDGRTPEQQVEYQQMYLRYSAWQHNGVSMTPEERMATTFEQYLAMVENGEDVGHLMWVMTEKTIFPNEQVKITPDTQFVAIHANVPKRWGNGITRYIQYDRATDTLYFVVDSAWTWHNGLEKYAPGRQIIFSETIMSMSEKAQKEGMSGSTSKEDYAIGSLAIFLLPQGIEESEHNPLVVNIIGE